MAVIVLLVVVSAGATRAEPRVEAGAKDPAFLDPFPRGSLWNTPLPARPALDPRSAEKIGHWLTQIRHPNVALRAYATAIAVASAETPKHTITCTRYPCPNMHRFGRVPIPAGTRADPSSDGHLAIWDPRNRREWDFWISECPAACGSAAGGGAFSTKTFTPHVRHGANAAGVPLLAGLLRPEEITARRIPHPLVFASPNVGRGHVCPARHDDGENPDPRALKEGMLLQLDPRIRVGELPIPEWQKTIARALQRYGMYLVDEGGTFSIRAENPINRGDVWADVGLFGDSALFESSFPWGSMRVLRPRARWCR